MTGTAWSIRLARPDDAEAMTRVEEDAAELFEREPTLARVTMPPSRSPEEYRAMIGIGRCLVAVEGDELVGFAACRPYGHEMHLHELSVVPAHQGQGSGRRLLYAAAVDAHASGVRAITLDT
ncbi:MAG: GNAT family N-acetyltransferase, partial [Qipengyuania sp.]